MAADGKTVERAFPLSRKEQKKEKEKKRTRQGFSWTTALLKACNE